MNSLRWLLACLFLLGFFNGCRDTSSATGGDCSPNYFKENFEGYSAGNFPNQYPWGLKAGPAAKLEATIVDAGCAKDTKCLKINMLSVSNDPNYDASVKASTGCHEDYPVIYSQFYIKYLYDDGRVHINYHAGAYFDIYLTNSGNYGSVEIPYYGMQPGDPFEVVVQNGNILPGKWYRIELMLNKPANAVLNIRVYEGESVTPVAGSTYVTNIPVNPIYRVGENKIDFEYLSTYLFENPSSDLNSFSLFLDDFAISNDPSILKVGFL